MSPQYQQFIIVTLAGSTFLLVLSLWIGAVLLWSSRKRAKVGRVRRRLGIESGHAGSERTLHLWLEGQKVSTKVRGERTRLSFLTRMELFFAKAGFELSGLQAVIFLLGIVAICTVFTAAVTRNMVLGAGLSVAVLVVFRIVMLARIASRESLFEEQLMDAMELASRSLRAGHPLMGAFQLLSEEMAPPVQTVFADICQQHGMGADLEGILRDAGDDSSSEDMKLFATSVAIQVRTGGNLADLMERLAAVIRDRMRLNRRVRVLTAQTQLSKRILVALPFVLFIVLNIMNPKYMSQFYDTVAGQVMLGVGVLLLALGIWIMNKLADLRY